MISLSALLKHYKRKDIQEEIIRNAKGREVAVKFGDKGFGKRPEVLQYPNDVLSLAQKGATSFHISEEHWRNPLQLSTELKKNELDDLRTGFDLVLDIDCHYLEYSKIAADLLVKALKHHNINSLSCKFSGNKGLHIAVPFKAFPKVINNIETRLLFPEMPRRITVYLRSMIKDILRNNLMEFENNDIQRIINNIGKSAEEITIKEKQDSETITRLNTESFLDIDTILISSRHLYRSVYSFNEKSGLVSVPLNPDKILLFNKEMAKPENVRLSKLRFLDKSNAAENEAISLVKQAYDFAPKTEEPKEEYKPLGIPKVQLDSPLPEQYFPPCIQNIFNGLEDGRKRALFILVNFLTNLGWDYENIEKRLGEWNKKNPEALREINLKGHVRYHKQKRKKILPPNCENKDYYKDIGVCKPDNLCNKIKNPVNYSMRKVKYLKKV
ncbi:hypothetical protein CMO89_02155 [Candidatus Woesearchaeota archaeon]|nr:hypothetical protein [Candidatus Woesearchaeota archaeon]|tara:strand:- start:17767 stop:19089 length:1323 start_codon:yes stop_codon:yes gene_type:complete